jgi:hypothetical protein
MAKLLIDVFTPGNGKTYEFLTDSAMLVERAMAHIINDILETGNDSIVIDISTAILSDVTLGKHLERGLTFDEAGVKSGHRLILL